ncbi:DMT family transporter [Paenibacillus sp. MWE-103]|uniref:DMT family transporter n=1 Tax=Paenibacillus artemisiicola TaxID=1172618 RepID=A0ABS3W2Z9_9BACL|nr:DMT family transporter [Paenibacillus artemisiicola]MBO7742655.1 DMT family transporter [Paenibacillus artemisiicola]
MNKVRYFGLVAITTFIMGLAFPVGKIALRYAPPFFMMSIRFVFAGILLALIVRLLGKRQPRGGRQWLQAAVIGLVQSGAVMGCAYYSMRWITSGESAIITCSNPLIVIVLGTLFGGATYRALQWLGVAVGLAGVAFAFGFQLGFQPGTFIGLGGAFSFAVATLLIKRWGPGFDMTVLAAYQMLAGGLGLLALSLITEQPRFTFSTSSVLVTLWLSLICSILQFALWFYLLRTGDPAKTSSFLFLVPVFGVLSSWLLLGEQVHWYVGVGGAFICAGIVLVNREPRKREAAAALSA